MCLICLGSRQVFLFLFSYRKVCAKKKKHWGNAALTAERFILQIPYVEVSGCEAIRLLFVRLQRVASGAQKTGIIYSFPVKASKIFVRLGMCN